MSNEHSGCGAESETTHGLVTLDTHTSSQVSEICYKCDDLNINECIPDDVLMMIFQYFNFKKAVHMLLSIGRSDLLARLPLRDFKVDTQGESHELCRVLTNTSSKQLRNVKWNHLPSPGEMKTYQNVEELTFTHSFKRSIHNFVFPEQIRRLHFGHSFKFEADSFRPGLKRVLWPPNLTHLTFANRNDFYDSLVFNVKNPSSFDFLMQLPSSVTHLKIDIPDGQTSKYMRFPGTIKVLTLTHKNEHHLKDKLDSILKINPHLRDYKQVSKKDYVMFISESS